MLEQNHPYVSPDTTHLPSPLHRCDSPSYEEWISTISRHLKRIQKKELIKIVCARRTSLTFPTKIDPIALLAKLKKTSPHTTLFAFQMNERAAFIGATPEILYQRKGNHITCDILAATAPLGSPHLLSRPKEQHEFNCVKQFVQETLIPHTTSLQIGSNTILQTATLHHLYSTITGSLHPCTCDHHLIASLHPTPALGGFPRTQALSLLHQEEPFTRGWYGAPIGWIDHQGADFAVGIRSALITDNTLHLFAGAGIVEGSSPEEEWNELERKIAPILQIIP